MFVLEKTFQGRYRFKVQVLCSIVGFPPNSIFDLTQSRLLVRSRRRRRACRISCFRLHFNRFFLVFTAQLQSLLLSFVNT